MSVKSTVRLTRDEAERQFQEYMIRWIAMSGKFTDKELEDALDQLADLFAGGESFANYRIGADVKQIE